MEFRSLLAIFTMSVIVLSGMAPLVPSAFATTWYVGQGLKPGDYYRYSIADVFYHNLEPFEMDFWVQNQTSSGGYNLQMVVHDGSIVQKGTVTIGNITPDPTYTPTNLANYVNVYRLTLTWLDSFAIKTHPVDILSPVWGQTGIYGEVSIGSIGMQNVTVPAGSFSASTLHFHDSGVDSYLWVAPSLAFPVKAQVYAIKTSGAPTIGYQYSLLEHGNSAQPPAFLNVQSTNPLGGNPQCPSPDYASDAVHDTQSTDSGSLAVEYYYSPSVPHQGCPMGWRISFEPVYSQTQKVSDIHYDIYAVDSQGHELSSLAQSIGRTDIYSAVGNDEQNFIENQPPPVAHYVIYVAGTGPESGVTDVSQAGMVKIDVKIAPPFSQPSSSATGLVNRTSTTVNNTPSVEIPSWIKNNAKWWSQGQVDDSQFVQGIQYLIQNGMMKIPKTSVTASHSQGIPAWVKNNAGWWASGQISDDEFVKGIEYLVANGIIAVNSQ
ncbi:MAG: hypothetical protein KGI27_05160 [Thaumarchaeota archaeon]|nr:hypothetical protein [Nitrososphaerota archaeon]